jgi:hypothetical protein
MARIFYVHWHQQEALETIRRLRAVGHDVQVHWNSQENAGPLLKQAAPDALIISLDRLPSHGREIAGAISESKRLRDLPIIFVGGEAEKVSITKLKFPDAIYCTSAKLQSVLRRVQPFSTAEPRMKPKASGEVAGYSGTPLPQKLGIKANHRLALLHEPPHFDETLGALPADVTITRKLLNGRVHNVIVLFVRTRAELERDFKKAATRLDPAGGLWISWPKKASGISTNLSEGVIRQIGLAAGLVDNKICAVDETWSGLRFVVRVKDRAKLTGQ